MTDETEQKTPGPTGEHPDGKLGANDAGAIQIMAGLHPKTGHIILDFGTPVKWIGFTSDEARAYSDALLRLADDSDRMKAKAQPW